MPKLIVAGSGIKSVAHITEETKKVIQSADKVLYLVHEDNLKAWISREAKNAESLDPIYFSVNKRVDAYHKLTHYIIEEYKKVPCLCVIFYGHPTVFADSALKAVKQIRAEGGNAIILPAISAMDCMFSDLEIDPGNQGCFSIDATELLVYERKLDVYSHNILWQVYSLGTHDITKTDKVGVLCDYLFDYYLKDHPICIYEAAIFPTQKPRMEWMELKNLTAAKLSSISTVYLAPAVSRIPNNKYLSLLGMSSKNFRC